MFVLAKVLLLWLGHGRSRLNSSHLVTPGVLAMHRRSTQLRGHSSGGKESSSPAGEKCAVRGDPAVASEMAAVTASQWREPCLLPPSESPAV